MREGTVNRETAERSDVVEKRICIAVVGEVHTFSLWVPRYVDGKLTVQDWVDLGLKLRDEKDAILRRMVASGSYFTSKGRQTLYMLIETTMRELAYRRFRQRQVEAGNDAWSVPSTMQGEEYKP